MQIVSETLHSDGLAMAPCLPKLFLFSGIHKRAAYHCIKLGKMPRLIDIYIMEILETYRRHKTKFSTQEGPHVQCRIQILVSRPPTTYFSITACLQRITFLKIRITLVAKLYSLNHNHHT